MCFRNEKKCYGYALRLSVGTWTGEQRLRREGRSPKVMMRVTACSTVSGLSSIYRTPVYRFFFFFIEMCSLLRN